MISRWVKVSININIVECKSILSDNSTMNALSININIVECKLKIMVI